MQRDAEFFVFFGVALARDTPDPAGAAAAEAWVGTGFTAPAALSDGESYVDFPEPRPGNWRHACYGENHARLVKVKNRYYPDHFFRNSRSIGSRRSSPQGWEPWGDDRLTSGR